MELSVRRLFLPGGTQSAGPQLFESTRLCESDICAKENRQCISTLAVFSWARVDVASRASKKAPQGPFCRRDVWRRPMLFESTLAALYKLPDKTETPVSLQHWSSWWARVDYASRAAKNSLAGCFCAVFGDSAAAVRIHPWICFEKFRTKEKLQHLHDAGVFGGAKQPKSEPLPSGASLAAISSKEMVFVQSL